jgi:hypothetical protein
MRLGRIKGTIMGDGGILTAEKRFALPTTATTHIIKIKYFSRDRVRKNKATRLEGGGMCIDKTSKKTEQRKQRKLKNEFYM